MQAQPARDFSTLSSQCTEIRVVDSKRQHRGGLCSWEGEGRVAEEVKETNCPWHGIHIPMHESVGTHACTRAHLQAHAHAQSWSYSPWLWNTLAMQADLSTSFDMLPH